MPRDLRIEEITQEAASEWFVHLRPGWQLDGAHCFGEDARSAIRETMKRVSPCECEGCQLQMIVGAIDELFAEMRREAG